MIFKETSAFPLLEEAEKLENLHLRSSRAYLLTVIIMFFLFIGIEIVQGEELLSYPSLIRELHSLWKEGREDITYLLIEDTPLFLDHRELTGEIRKIVENREYPFYLRKSALSFLSRQMEGKERGEYLISLFQREPSVAIQVEIIRLLGETDDWIPFLFSILQGGNSSNEKEEVVLQWEALRALAHWKVRESLPFFFRLVEKEDFPPELKEEADELLSLYDFSVSSYLLAMTNSENPFFREIALFTLWERGDNNIMSYAYKMSNDQDKKVSNLSQAILWGEGKIPHLVLQGEDLDSRLIRVLTQYERGVNLLIEIGEKDPMLEEQIFESLGEIEDIAFTSLLKEKLKEREWRPLSLLRFLPQGERAEIIFSLLASSGEELYLQEEEIPPLSKEDLRSNLYLIRETLLSGSERAQLFILRRLPILGEEALPLLEIATRETSLALQREIIRALEEIEAPATIYFLERLAFSPYEEIEIRARLALAKKYLSQGYSW